MLPKCQHERAKAICDIAQCQGWDDNIVLQTMRLGTPKLDVLLTEFWHMQEDGEQVAHGKAMRYIYNLLESQEQGMVQWWRDGKGPLQVQRKQRKQDRNQGSARHQRDKRAITGIRRKESEVGQKTSRGTSRAGRSAGPRGRKDRAAPP